MFDKISQAAEKAAVVLSRRALLGRLGSIALTTAATVASALALTGSARAGSPSCARHCHQYCSACYNYCMRLCRAGYPPYSC